jgi:hypothetical protein
MRRSGPFKKTKNDDDVWSSMAKPEKGRDCTYMTVEMAMTLHHQNALMGWKDVHLSGGRLLDTSQTYL